MLDLRRVFPSLWPCQIIFNLSCSFVLLLINIRNKKMKSRTHPVSPTLEQNQEPPTLPLYHSPTLSILPPQYPHTFPTLPPPHYHPPPSFPTCHVTALLTSPTLPPHYPTTFCIFTTLSPFSCKKIYAPNLIVTLKVSCMS